MTIFQELNKLSPSEMSNAGIIEPAKTMANGYPTIICPFCGSGSGKNGSGMTVKKNTNGKYFYTCWSTCAGGNKGKQYTNYDLLSKVYRINSGGEMAKKIKELFPTLAADNFPKNQPSRKTPQKFYVQRDYSSFYSIVQSKLENFLIGHNENLRGLTIDELRGARAGIATAADLKSVGEYVEPGDYLILPYHDKRFFIRSVEGAVKTVKRCNSGSGKEIYDPYHVDFTGTIFVVEGEIDCLSIHKASEGAIKVVAVGGTSGYPVLTKFCKQFDSDNKPNFVIIADNNDGGAGVDSANKAAQSLIKSGFAAVVVVLNTQNQYDANEYLQNDSEGLKIRLQEILRNSADKIAQMESEIELKNGGRRFGTYFANNFDNAIDTMTKYADKKTGFENLDSIQPFYPGLYVVGGLPAVGKTTFVWQLLEQFAQNKEHCIYCSYEMSELELFSKSVARECNKRVFKEWIGNAERRDDATEQAHFLTSAKIRRNDFPQVDDIFGDGLVDWQRILNKVKQDFSQSTIDLRVIELRDETIDDLLERLNKICQKLDKPPIICIDYLQVIPSSKETAKSAVDDTVKKLKDFQRDTNAILFVISSLNRENYNNSISLQSFKESGNIEYSADVTWGLQIYVDETAENAGKRKEITAAARKKPVRHIHLKCLKNRNGNSYDVYFIYYAPCDYFTPMHDLPTEIIPPPDDSTDAPNPSTKSKR